MSMNKTACLKESAGCFWFNATEVLCGKSIPLALCTPCNDQLFGSVRSPLSHQQLGKTCSWPAVAPFTQGAQVTLTDFATASTGGCTALDAAKPDDAATISKFLSTMGSVSASAVSSCGGAAMPTTTTPVMTPPVMTQVGGKAAKKNAKKAKKGKKAKAASGEGGQ
jgi:hypothetical protein